MTTQSYQKEVIYSRETRDFDALLNGEWIGCFATRQEAEEELDAIVAKRQSVGSTLMGEPVETTALYFDADELETAYTAASAHDMPQTWRNALNRAYDLLLTCDAIPVEFAPDGSIAHAMIPSQTTDETYRVNGTCTCTAAQHDKPCVHRAAKRLLERCHEERAAMPRLTVREPVAVAEKPAATTQKPVGTFVPGHPIFNKANPFPAWATRRGLGDDLFKDED